MRIFELLSHVQSNCKNLLSYMLVRAPDGQDPVYGVHIVDWEDGWRKRVTILHPETVVRGGFVSDVVFTSLLWDRLPREIWTPCVAPVVKEWHFRPSHAWVAGRLNAPSTMVSITSHTVSRFYEMIPGGACPAFAVAFTTLYNMAVEMGGFASIHDACVVTIVHNGLTSWYLVLLQNREQKVIVLHVDGPRLFITKFKDVNNRYPLVENGIYEDYLTSAFNAVDLGWKRLYYYLKHRRNKKFAACHAPLIMSFLTDVRPAQISFLRDAAMIPRA